MEQFTFTPKFVNTRNARNTNVLMNNLLSASRTGEGCIGVIYSEAGLGKTQTTKKWHTDHAESIHLTALTAWYGSELAFLKTLCRELGIKSPPGRKGPAFMAIVDTLLNRPMPIFIDEIEKLNARFLDLVKDITDLSTAPIVLVGEEHLVTHMKKNRRIWSRTFQHLKFERVQIGDAAAYAKETTGIKLTPETLSVLFKGVHANFRELRRTLIALVDIANARGLNDTVDVETINIALNAGLVGGR